MDYKLCKKLKEAGFPQGNMKGYRNYYSSPYEIHVYAIFDVIQPYSLTANTKSPPVYNPSLPELIEACLRHCNELAMGWSDSGCYWRFQYGGRGCGSMMDGFGKKFQADSEDSIEDSVALLWLELNK
jgi:hypothetical protein